MIPANLMACRRDPFSGKPAFPLAALREKTSARIGCFEAELDRLNRWLPSPAVFPLGRQPGRGPQPAAHSPRPPEDPLPNTMIDGLVAACKCFAGSRFYDHLPRRMGQRLQPRGSPPCPDVARLPPLLFCCVRRPWRSEQLVPKEEMMGVPRTSTFPAGPKNVGGRHPPCLAGLAARRKGQARPTRKRKKPERPSRSSP